MRIDFVSDVACPWCVIGLQSLEAALARMPELHVDIHFQPFELNPQMPPEGQDIDEHLQQKYGASPAQMAGTREALRQRGAELGFTFTPGARSRIHNTFDAHRLLHWAGQHSPAAQRALKMELFTAYFTDGLNPGDPDVLVARAHAAGLDGKAAREVLSSGAFADEVRAAERFYQDRGISAVPSVVIDDRHLIQGGQPIEAFEQALRQIAASP
jgi:predicted DsbA family dithiol-disulfide isomerase